MENLGAKVLLFRQTYNLDSAWVTFTQITDSV